MNMYHTYHINSSAWTPQCRNTLLKDMLEMLSYSFEWGDQNMTVVQRVKAAK